MRDKFSSVGRISILETVINGSLDCTGATLSNPFSRDVAGSGEALRAVRTVIKGSAFLRAGFTAEGQVDLSYATIGAALDCSGGTFSRSTDDLPPSTGEALRCVSIHVGGSANFSSPNSSSLFVAHGIVSLDNGEFGGDVFFDGSRLINPLVATDNRTGVALTAFSIKVTRGLYLRNGFQANGRVYVANSSIEQVVSVRKGTIVAPADSITPRTPAGLAIRSTSVKGAIYIDDGFTLDGFLDLTDTQTNTIFDDPKFWPKPGKLVLSGFVYKVFGNAPYDADGRLQWLNLQSESTFFQQPYLQLSRVLS